MGKDGNIIETEDSISYASEMDDYYHYLTESPVINDTPDFKDKYIEALKDDDFDINDFFADENLFPYKKKSQAEHEEEGMRLKKEYQMLDDYNAHQIKKNRIIDNEIKRKRKTWEEKYRPGNVSEQEANILYDRFTSDREFDNWNTKNYKNPPKNNLEFLERRQKFDYHNLPRVHPDEVAETESYERYLNGIMPIPNKENGFANHFHPSDEIQNKRHIIAEQQSDRQNPPNQKAVISDAKTSPESQENIVKTINKILADEKFIKEFERLARKKIKLPGFWVENGININDYLHEISNFSNHPEVLELIKDFEELYSVLGNKKGEEKNREGEDEYDFNLRKEGEEELSKKAIKNFVKKNKKLFNPQESTKTKNTKDKTKDAEYTTYVGVIYTIALNGLPPRVQAFMPSSEKLLTNTGDFDKALVPNMSVAFWEMQKKGSEYQKQQAIDSVNLGENAPHIIVNFGENTTHLISNVLTSMVTYAPATLLYLTTLAISRRNPAAYKEFQSSFMKSVDPEFNKQLNYIKTNLPKVTGLAMLSTTLVLTSPIIPLAVIAGVSASLSAVDLIAKSEMRKRMGIPPSIDKHTEDAQKAIMAIAIKNPGEEKGYDASTLPYDELISTIKFYSTSKYTGTPENTALNNLVIIQNANMKDNNQITALTQKLRELDQTNPKHKKEIDKLTNQIHKHRFNPDNDFQISPNQTLSIESERIIKGLDATNYPNPLKTIISQYQDNHTCNPVQLSVNATIDFLNQSPEIPIIPSDSPLNHTQTPKKGEKKGEKKNLQFFLAQISNPQNFSTDMEQDKIDLMVEYTELANKILLDTYNHPDSANTPEIDQLLKSVNPTKILEYNLYQPVEEAIRNNPVNISEFIFDTSESQILAKTKVYNFQSNFTNKTIIESLAKLETVYPPKSINQETTSREDWKGWSAPVDSTKKIVQGHHNHVYSKLATKLAIFSENYRNDTRGFVYKTIKDISNPVARVVSSSTKEVLTKFRQSLTTLSKEISEDKPKFVKNLANALASTLTNTTGTASDFNVTTQATINKAQVVASSTKETISKFKQALKTMAEEVPKSAKKILLAATASMMMGTAYAGDYVPDLNYLEQTHIQIAKESGGNQNSTLSDGNKGIESSLPDH